MPRKSAWSKLQDHFHTHPQGRLHEILFWAGLGLVMAALSFVGWQQGFLSTPIALILAVISTCFVLWSMLPTPKPKQVAPPRHPKSRRKP